MLDWLKNCGEIIIIILQKDEKRVPYTRGEKVSREVFIQMVKCMDRGIGKILQK